MTLMGVLTLITTVLHLFLLVVLVATVIGFGAMLMTPFWGLDRMVEAQVQPAA